MNEASPRKFRKAVRHARERIHDLKGDASHATVLFLKDEALAVQAYGTMGIGAVMQATGSTGAAIAEYVVAGGLLFANFLKHRDSRQQAFNAGYTARNLVGEENLHGKYTQESPFYRSPEGDIIDPLELLNKFPDSKSSAARAANLLYDSAIRALTDHEVEILRRTVFASSFLPRLREALIKKDENIIEHIGELTEVPIEPQNIINNIAPEYALYPSQPVDYVSPGAKYLTPDQAPKHWDGGPLED